jgi:hypothetical protein
MESTEVEARVRTEVDGKWTRSNAHGVDLAKSLVAPERIRCRSLDAGAQGEELDLWLVLTEIPESRDGYLIVCDESAKEFGLAMPTTEGYVAFLGWYGGFWDAFEGM